MKRSLKQIILSRPGVAGAIVGVGLVGVALGGVASAQTPTPTAGQNQAAAFIQRLAQHLGLPQETVTQALQATRNDALNEAVAAGRLTQEQADRIRNQPIDQGHGPGFGFGGNGRPGHSKGLGRGLGASLDTAAQHLGLSQEDLRAQLQTGQSLADVARSRNIDPQTLITQLVADAQSRIAQAVQSGQITQAQADQMTQSLPDRVRQMVEATHTPGERGPRGLGPRPSASPPASIQ